MIAPAEPDDAPAIAALWNTMIRETLSTFTTIEKPVSEIEALISTRTDGFFVARDAGVCVGFATFGRFRPGPGYSATMEHSVIIAPQGQGRGLGRRLLEVLENAARRQDHHVMIAAISGTNTRAQAFHHRLGYREVARMPQVGRKAGQWLDLVLMQKIL